MGAIFSMFNKQINITTRPQLDESINLFRNNETSQAHSTNLVDQHHHHDHDHDQLISSFLEIAVGQTVETARKFLQTTNWNIEEAINLFLMNNNYHDPSVYYSHQVASSRSDETWSNSTTSETSEDDSILSSLFRPLFDLLFEGSFEDAKSASVKKNLWLIVNLQSRTEFASHTLNRDVWSNEAVLETVKSSFLLWQVYDHTREGQKISSFYKTDSVLPVVLVIDPITGQKMRMWSGVIKTESFIEDLMPFMDDGPNEHIASLTRKIFVKETCSSRNDNNDQVVAPSWGEEFEEEDIISSRILTDQVIAPSWGEEFENMETCLSSNLFDEENETCSTSNNTDHIVAPSWLEFPVLTEEPKGDCDRSIVRSLCVRFPDGRRKQRRFLKTEPVQLLWSFCDSHMEVSEKKVFKLVHAIPGALKTLDYGVRATFDQSELHNSMISVTWE